LLLSLSFWPLDGRGEARFEGPLRIAVCVLAASSRSLLNDCLVLSRLAVWGDVHVDVAALALPTALQ